ncbi:MAG TPA: mersacidin/lichenicidin family type 2 lantibiotic [Ktedonobacteraceae bacterium]|nr:mersacidin/lichenicidin family type 2 lantibiotic [Ktedonobacteraceae bacterium]
MQLDIVRAWKDDVYRQSLTGEELALLPENPIGEYELSDADLEMIYGGGSCYHKAGHKDNHGGGIIYHNNSFALLCVQSVAILGACTM